MSRVHSGEVRHEWPGRWRPMPMFMRVFGAMVLMVVLGSWTFGSVLSVYQDRATAATIAPLWAAAMRASGADPAVRGAGYVKRDVAIPVELRFGEPPASAYSIANDGRIVTLTSALAKLGFDVHEVLLEDAAEAPITWLDVYSDAGSLQGGRRWIGVLGGVQPGDFRRRLWLGLGALVGLVLLTSWFVSRWVASPLLRLSRQVDDIARGGMPEQAVRGVREIDHLSAAIMAMARQRAAFDDQRRTMLMGVSHDLRSPLTRIRVAADLLDGEAATARLGELIVRNVAQADAIIESFSGYVRADAEPVNEEVDVAAVVRAAGAAALKAEDVRIEPAPAIVRGNALLLSRLIGNLVDNAQRHGEAPVRLSMAVDMKRNEVNIAVDDAGPGIADPERMRRPFERGDAARQLHGSGLGLAIATRVAERHSGSLSIERGELGGARVCARLPLLQA